MNEILKVKNLGMKYHTSKGETLALKNINFSVYSEEFLSIVGPSGCGKSTVLSLISGLLNPSFGEVILSGDLKNKKRSDVIGYMLQSDYLFEWRNIEKNVLLGLEVKKILNEKSRDYALNLLKRYGLLKFKNYFPNQLSGGMRQKAALIRTLALKPQLLLLDEPFSALDYQTRITLSREVKNIIKKEKKTAILVTHDISEAITLSDRVVILSNRPSTVKKIIDIDIDFRNLPYGQKQRSKKFYDYFDVIWSELDENKKEF